MSSSDEDARGCVCPILYHGVVVMGGRISRSQIESLQGRGVEVLTDVDAADVSYMHPSMAGDAVSYGQGVSCSQCVCSPSTSGALGTLLFALVYLKEYSESEMEERAAGITGFHHGWSLGAFVAEFQPLCNPLTPQILSANEWLVEFGICEQALIDTLMAGAKD